LAHRRRNKLEKSLKESPALARERTPSTPKAVIFDIGRVIVRLDLKRALTPIAAAMQGAVDQSAKRLSPEDAWELIRADQHWHDWQEGRISSAEWHQHLMHRLKLSLNYVEFRDAWNLVLDPELILGESLFVQLSARCRLALLSNTDPIHVECLEQRFTFGRHFPVRIYSCRVGTSKPSPVIYRAALESLGVAAPEALYIDDIQEFVDAARQLGLDAIRFETRDLLELELRRRYLC
jgi:glucose-1-phosphatase